jgi:hypothetical protein
MNKGLIVMAMVCGVSGSAWACTDPANYLKQKDAGTTLFEKLADGTVTCTQKSFDVLTGLPLEDKHFAPKLTGPGSLQEAKSLMEASLVKKLALKQSLLQLNGGKEFSEPVDQAATLEELDTNVAPMVEEAGKATWKVETYQRVVIETPLYDPATGEQLEAQPGMPLVKSVVLNPSRIDWEIAQLQQQVENFTAYLQDAEASK